MHRPHHFLKPIVQIIVDLDCLNGGSSGGGPADGDPGVYNPGDGNWNGLIGGIPTGGNPDNSNPDEPHTGNPNTVGDSNDNDPNPNPDFNDGSGNPILTTPLLPVREPQDPCDQLKKLLESSTTAPATKPNIKPLLEDLIEDASSPINYETGYQFSKNQNGEYNNEWIQPNTASNSSIMIDTGGDVYGGAHIHTNWLYPMYSWSDVYVLFELFRRGAAHVKSESVYILVTKECLTCSQVKVYALKIDDFLSFRVKIFSDMNNTDTVGYDEEQKRKYANEKFQEKFENTTNYEQMFLEYFAEHNISMYEANEDLTEWSKLSLSGSPLQPVTEQPCN